MTDKPKAPTRRSLTQAVTPAKPPARVRPSARKPPVAPAEPAAPVPAAEPRSAPEEPSGRRGVKYTAVLDDDTTDAFESLTRIARRKLGRHVDKVEVLRALVLLAADDTSLRDQMINGLGQPLH